MYRPEGSGHAAPVCAALLGRHTFAQGSHRLGWGGACAGSCGAVTTCFFFVWCEASWDTGSGHPGIRVIGHVMTFFLDTGLYGSWGYPEIPASGRRGLNAFRTVYCVVSLLFCAFLPSRKPLTTSVITRRRERPARTGKAPSLPEGRAEMVRQPAEFEQPIRKVKGKTPKY